VSTDKVDAEVPAPASGTLTRIAAGAGETVAVGALLGEIAANGAASSAGNGGGVARPEAPGEPGGELLAYTAREIVDIVTPKAASRSPRARSSSGRYGSATR